MILSYIADVLIFAPPEKKKKQRETEKKKKRKKQRKYKERDEERRRDRHSVCGNAEPCVEHYYCVLVVLRFERDGENISPDPAYEVLIL